MKTLKLGVCFLDEENNVITKRVIGTNWHITGDELKVINERPKDCMKDEVASVLTETLKLQLTTDVIKEMLGEIDV